jgi:F-type H+-transporting ATPase subunit alpha
MIPVGRGQRELVGDRQTGKSTVCIDTILNQKNFTMQETCILYICCNWTKASTVAGIAKMLEEKVQWLIPLLLLLTLLIQLQCKCMLLSQVLHENFRDSGRPALIVYDDLSKQAVAYREVSFIKKTTGT